MKHNKTVDTLLGIAAFTATIATSTGGNLCCRTRGPEGRELIGWRQEGIDPQKTTISVKVVNPSNRTATDRIKI